MLVGEMVFYNEEVMQTIAEQTQTLESKATFFTPMKKCTNETTFVAMSPFVVELQTNEITISPSVNVFVIFFGAKTLIVTILQVGESRIEKNVA